jgi:hypothetical protein
MTVQVENQVENSASARVWLPCSDGATEIRPNLTYLEHEWKLVASPANALWTGTPVFIDGILKPRIALIWLHS